MSKKSLEKSNLTKNQQHISKLLSFIMLFLIIISLSITLYFVSKKKESQSSTNKVFLDEKGRQVLNIEAKSGFFPNKLSANSNIPSLLEIKTDNTYDCTSSLSIPKLSYTKQLSPNGVEHIDIPPQAFGTEIYGTCNTGLYHFTIRFE